MQNVLGQAIPLLDPLVAIVVDYLGRVPCLLAELTDSKMSSSSATRRRRMLRDLIVGPSATITVEELSCCDDAEFKILLASPVTRGLSSTDAIHFHNRLLQAIILSSATPSFLLWYAKKYPGASPRYEWLIARASRSPEEKKAIFDFMDSLITHNNDRHSQHGKKRWRRMWYRISQNDWQIQFCDLEDSVVDLKHILLTNIVTSLHCYFKLQDVK